MKFKRISMAMVVSSALASLGMTAAQAGTALYTSSNSAAGNTVVHFEQGDNGTLSLVGEYPTGGLGTDSGLGNQSAIALDNEFLYVVNAGSNEVSSFRFVDGGLEFADKIDSGGLTPVSVTVDRGVLYVLNADSDSISGFSVSSDGELNPLAGSNRGLSTTGTAPAQIGFSKDGRVLIVTEKATNRVVTYTVDRHGIAGTAQVHASPGMTPFGFAVTAGRRVIVSEAFGGAPGLSTVTSWKVAPHGDLTVLDPTEPTLQSAACWVAVTPNGQFAFTANTASSSLTGFRIKGDDLTLTNLDGVAASPGPGTGPIDLTISPDGEFLHTLNGGDDSISTFRITNFGALEPVGQIAGLPDRATGLVTR